MEVQTPTKDSPAPQASPAPQPDADSPQTGAADPQQLGPAIEAVLLTLDKPTPAARLAQALHIEGDETSGPKAIEQAIADLNEQYAQTGRSFRIEKIAGGYRLMTLAPFAPVVAAFHVARNKAKLSRPAIETLAIVAYKQPITRADLESIRGVSCGEVLRSLIDRRLITITGRAEELGRPMLYGTTKDFLDVFGLSSVKDLPPVTEFVTS
jgi:segregation and condensation protein B